MKKIAVISIFPKMFEAVCHYGVSRKAIENGLVDILYFNPRDFTQDSYKSVDDRPFGGGPGMVMLAEPLYKAIKSAKTALGHDSKVIYLSPQGKQVTQGKINAMSLSTASAIFICGRYEGIDERIIDTCVDEELCIGDFVVSGGELPAMILIDAMIRLVPGVLGHGQSAVEDSFYNGLLDCPHYTRPAELDKLGDVPSVLLNGNHKEISAWRKQQSLSRTLERRPEMIDSQCLSQKDIQLLTEYKNKTKTM
jgi:tRNA (guanine37-N1)-methyltransferase